MIKGPGLLVAMGLAIASGPAAADQADPFTTAEHAYFARFDPGDGGTMGPGRLDDMWRISPTRTLAALRKRIEAGGGDLPLVLIAMSASQVHDPRLADFLIAEHDRASVAVKRDLLAALAPYDGADDHVEEFLRRAGAGHAQATRALELIESRKRLGFDDTAKLVEELSAATYVPLADQAILRGLAITLDGEVTDEGELRALIGGTQVRATFDRDLEARAAFTADPGDWVHLDGVLRAAHPGEDDAGKYVELALSYAGLTKSTAPRTATTRARKQSGCGCASGEPAAWPLALLVLVALSRRATSRGSRS